MLLRKVTILHYSYVLYLQIQCTCIHVLAQHGSTCIDGSGTQYLQLMHLQICLYKMYSFEWEQCVMGVPTQSGCHAWQQFSCRCSTKNLYKPQVVFCTRYSIEEM